MDALLLSPPVPSTIEPSWCIGVYPPEGSAPMYQVVRPPLWELPPLRAKVVWPLFYNSAVTNGVALPLVAVLERFPLISQKTRTPTTHKPNPQHDKKKHEVPRLT